MKNLMKCFLVATIVPLMAHALEADLIRKKVTCVQQAVASRMNFPIPAEVEFPQIVFSEESSIEEFDNEIEGFWKFRPGVFSNAYNALTNKLFLYNGDNRYKKPRTVLDSLAHEFTHFYQFIKLDRNLDQMKLEDDQSELEAVRVQE